MWVPRKWKNSLDEDILTEDVFSLRVESRRIIQCLWVPGDVELLLLSINLHRILLAESLNLLLLVTDWQSVPPRCCWHLSAFYSCQQANNKWQVQQCVDNKSQKRYSFQLPEDIFIYNSLSMDIFEDRTSSRNPHYTTKSYVHFGIRSSFKSYVFDNYFQFGSDLTIVSKERNKRTPTMSYSKQARLLLPPVLLARLCSATQDNAPRSRICLPVESAILTKREC